MSGPLLRAEDLVRELDELKPFWDGQWSLERYLKAFDESGVLRPVYRVHLPERYAFHLAAKNGLESEVTLEEKEILQFERLDQLLGEWHGGFGDPEAPDLFDQLPPELTGMIRRSSADERVLWSDWERVVSYHDGRPLTRQFVFSFYGEWHRLRFWALLEAYTFRALMDPRTLHPQQVFDPAWDRDTRGRLMTSTVGNPRILRLVELLEADDWLMLLYLIRDVISWGEMRVQEPHLARWAGGEPMTIEDRAASETVRVRERCQLLGKRWLNDRGSFLSRLRLLVELSSHASEATAARFGSAIEQDLRAAVRWAGFMYGDDFTTLDRDLGPDQRDRRTLGAVLRPTWTAARNVGGRHVPEFVEAFAREVKVLTMDPSESGQFLDFLNAQELSAWQLEFAGLVAELQSPSDTSWDRRFLHIRSMANLVEPVLVALADQYGTPADRLRMKRGDLKDPLKAFLADRTGDWRARLWQIVSENWELANTIDRTLPERLDEVSAASWEPELTVLARTILTFAVVRNFGSHRFTREAALLVKYQGQLFRAVVWTPLLYWKLATSLG